MTTFPQQPQSAQPQQRADPGAIQRIIASVLNSGSVNPSRGVDPNPPGGVLRDRFHQVRGDEYRQIANARPGMDETRTAHADQLAAELVQSRGAPLTAQNLQIAKEYLLGGGLGRFEQQQTTENEIADEAIAADGGGARGGGGAAVPVSPAAPPSPSAGPPLADAPPADDGGAGLGFPFVLPGKRVTDAPRPGEPVPPALGGPRGLEGEIVRGVPAVRTPAGVPARTAADAAIEDAIVVGVNPADASRALPAPSADAVPPAEPDVSALPAIERISPDEPTVAAPKPTEGASAADEAAEDAATADALPDKAPITEEEIVPGDRGRAISSGIVNGVEYKVYQNEDGSYTGVREDGKEVTSRPTVRAVRKALRRIPI